MEGGKKLNTDEGKILNSNEEEKKEESKEKEEEEEEEEEESKNDILSIDSLDVPKFYIEFVLSLKNFKPYFPFKKSKAL